MASDPTTTTAFLDGWRIAFLVQAVFMIAAAVIAWMYRPSTHPNDERN